MNILILPGAETVLSNQEIDWIQKTIPGNEKVLVDAIDFAVNHPETYVGILIGRYEDSFDYTIEVKEIDREDLDYWQLRGEVRPTNYTADIIRIEKTKIDCNEVEELEEEDDKGERRLLAGQDLFMIHLFCRHHHLIAAPYLLLSDNCTYYDVQPLN
jgi:hypothetical protein